MGTYRSPIAGMWKSTFIIAAVCTGILTATAFGVDSYKTGQKVEVREGDSWSPATVTGQEGRKYHIHYDASDDSTDEWVTTDRIRKPNAIGATPPVTPPVKAAPKPAANAAFTVGEQIECKWGGLWRKAVVVRKHDDWTMVIYDSVWYEWVQPWRLRTIGSTYDTTEDSQPRGNAEKGTPAPEDPPETKAEDPDPDASHISETVGPRKIAISKAELTGHDVEPTTIKGSPAPDATPIAPAPRMISLNHGAPKFDVTTELAANPQGRYALLTFVPRSENESVSIQRIELGRGDADHVAQLTEHVMPLAISLDGKRIITRSDKFFPDTKWRLDLWSIDTSSPKPLLSFRPYDPGENGSDEVLWASYLDADHLMTCSGGHTLTLWQLTDTAVKEVYTLQGDNTVHPQMSAGGKYVVVGFGGQAMVCEAMTGQCVARAASLTDADGMVSSVSSDVKRLALSGQRRLIVCDLAQDKVLFDVGLPEGVTGDHVDWITQNLLLLDHRWIFDVDRKAMLWEYTLTGGGKTPLAKFMNDRVWFLAESGTAYAGGSGHSVLTSMSLPDSKILTLDKKLPEGTIVIQPGAKVSLEVNVNAPDDERKKIVDRLTRQLQDAGLAVADGQSIKLVADSKETGSRQVTYHSRFGGSSETVSVSNTEMSLTFTVDSKPVWSITSVTIGSAPIMVFHTKDKSIAETLADRNKPRFEWFLSTSLPKTILKPEDPAGSSPFGVAGGRSRNNSR
jgi:hypothetical protein